jgi:hypothetical protein
VQLAVGWPAIVLAAIGVVIAIWKKAWWPVLLLLLPPFFYVMSMHSSGTPIFIPTLWPKAWYNTRYALAALPFIALCAGAIVVAIPKKFAWPAALILAAIPATLWAIRPDSICFKESEVNSTARREWTHRAAAYLAQNYQAGDGVIFPFGDMTGILREAGIPLREALHDGNGAAFSMAVDRPELFLQSRWALAFSGDPIATAILRAGKRGPRYVLRASIMVKNAPVVEIYQRENGPIRAALCEAYIGQACAPREDSETAREIAERER